jgi:hypothetical protein
VLFNHRVIYKDNSVLSDFSSSLSDYISNSKTLPFVAAEDALYIGSDYPFNHRWVEVSTANDQASTISVSLWNGTSWHAAVDLIDQTSVGGVSLSQSGIVAWGPDRNSSWQRAESTENISELSSLKLYRLYWAKITFSGNLKATTALKYVGYKFSSDEDLTSEYPQFLSTALKSSYKSGKTDWSEQAFKAGEYVLEHLRNKGTIASPNQILDWRQFRTASVHKTAKILFGGMGDDYIDQAIEAERAFNKAMEIRFPILDRNLNATEDDEEKQIDVRYMTR